MRVLFINRNSYSNSIAGDSVQMMKTKDYLEKLQVRVELNCSPELDLTAYSLVHLFNIMPVEEVYPLFLNALRQKKKIVLSPIFWDPDEFLKHNREHRDFKTWWQKTMPLRKEILNKVDLILPNSRLELEALEHMFSRLPPARVIPNAADPLFASAKPDRFINRFKWKDFLLSVGRICRRKNQLGLIKAVKSLKIPLVIIGPLNDSIYYQECRREAAGTEVLFLDSFNQNDLSSAYAAARVHALTSWYDTPGLVSLEAALAGCQIVTTDRGSASEYFGDLAFYCDPNNQESIRLAITKAWSAKKDDRLKNLVLEKYIWDRTAVATLEAYKKVLNVN